MNDVMKAARENHSQFQGLESEAKAMLDLLRNLSTGDFELGKDKPVRDFLARLAYPPYEGTR